MTHPFEKPSGVAYSLRFCFSQRVGRSSLCCGLQENDEGGESPKSMVISPGRDSRSTNCSRPVAWMIDELLSDRIGVHAVMFLEHLCARVDVEIVIASLPESAQKIFLFRKTPSELQVGLRPVYPEFSSGYPAMGKGRATLPLALCARPRNPRHPSSSLFFTRLRTLFRNGAIATLLKSITSGVFPIAMGGGGRHGFFQKPLWESHKSSALVAQISKWSKVVENPGCWAKGGKKTVPRVANGSSNVSLLSSPSYAGIVRVVTLWNDGPKH